MFRSIAIRGDGATLLLGGFRPVAELGAWQIARTEPPDAKWTLEAKIHRVDRFSARQRGVVFSAPRFGGGRWFWPIKEISIHETAPTLVAVLHPPEQ